MEAELPEPSAELVLIRAWIDVILRHKTPKERARIVRDMNAEMALRRELGALATIRPRQHDSALATARRKAADWWDAWREGYERKVG
jgi:hypothetical protein